MYFSVCIFDIKGCVILCICTFVKNWLMWFWRLRSFHDLLSTNWRPRKVECISAIEGLWYKSQLQGRIFSQLNQSNRRSSLPLPCVLFSPSMYWMMPTYIEKVNKTKNKLIYISHNKHIIYIIKQTVLVHQSKW
jgi:hypothetical protein